MDTTQDDLAQHAGLPSASSNLISIDAVVVPDGEDPTPHLIEAGIIDPVWLPFSLRRMVRPLHPWVTDGPLASPPRSNLRWRMRLGFRMISCPRRRRPLTATIRYNPPNKRRLSTCPAPMG